MLTLQIEKVELPLNHIILKLKCPFILGSKVRAQPLEKRPLTGIEYCTFQKDPENWHGRKSKYSLSRVFTCRYSKNVLG